MTLLALPCSNASFWGQMGGCNLLTRAPDLRQAQQTSTLSDAQIHIWKDIEGVSPASTLADLVKSLGYRGKIAMETETPGLTFANGQSVIDAFDQSLQRGRWDYIEPAPR